MIPAMETLSPLAMYVVPSVVGILFALIGVAYRLGQARGIGTPTVVLYMAAAGAAVFGWLSLGTAWAEVPARVLVLGIAAGVAQYLTIRLCGAALRRGPLSPLWCALNLVFVVVIVYAWAALGESLSPAKLVALAVAVGAVVVASVATPPAEGAPAAGGGAVYFAILLGAMLSNAVLHTALKDLGTRELPGGGPISERFGMVFLFLVYTFLGLPIVAELVLTRARDVFSPAAVGAGALAAFGSLAGFFLLAASAGAPAAVVFTLSAIFSLMGGSLASVVFFGEKASGRWFLMMGLAIAAVVLVSL